MFDWVTPGLTAPGVQRGSGSENSPEPRAWQEPEGGWDCTTLELALLTGSVGRAGAPGAGGCGCPPWRCPDAGRRCEGADFDLDVLAVAVMLAPPEVAVPGAAALDELGAAAVELDELLEPAEQPATSAQQAAAASRHARLDTPVPLTAVSLVADSAEADIGPLTELRESLEDHQLPDLLSG